MTRTIRPPAPRAETSNAEDASEARSLRERLRGGARRFVTAAFAPVDGASLAAWRATVGGGLAFWALKQLTDRGDGRTWADGYWGDPARHFKYTGFEWVAAPAEPYLSWLLLAVAAAGLALACGLFTRVSAALTALGFTWLVLIERTTYQNHYYLLVLVSWATVLLPLGHVWSADNRLWGRAPRAVPRWAVWLVQFQVGLPYFYGGVAKLNADWLSGEPMANMLYGQEALADTWLAPLTAVLPGGAADEWFPQTALAFAWGGLALDLVIVPLLLWRPTRRPAYLGAVLFHLTNATLFTIGVFPWFMILATLIFFPPDWPRQLLARVRFVPRRLLLPPTTVAAFPTGPRRRAATLAALGLYVSSQCLIPLRHHLYEGSP
ncbi:MAG: HTTM domain-containing protein, partial [Planctomycetota bacterium]